MLFRSEYPIVIQRVFGIRAAGELGILDIFQEAGGCIMPRPPRRKAGTPTEFDSAAASNAALLFKFGAGGVLNSFAEL